METVLNVLKFTGRVFARVVIWIAGKLDEARDTLLHAGQYMAELGKAFGKLSRIRLSDGKVTEFISA